MKRRTLVRKLGAAGIGAAAVSGTVTARRPTITDLDVGELDVSSVEGWVALEELLEAEELAALPAGVDPAERISVAPEADAITPSDCCALCCGKTLDLPDCSCYTCDFIEGCTDA